MLLRSEWKSLVSVVKCVCQEYGLVELPSESKNESLKATIWLQRLSTTWVIWELLRVDWLMCRNTAGRFGFCLVLRTPLPGFCFLHQTESMPKQLRFFRMEAEDPRFGNARQSHVHSLVCSRGYRGYESHCFGHTQHSPSVDKSLISALSVLDSFEAHAVRNFVCCFFR